jgi:hypothetical protein
MPAQSDWGREVAEKGSTHASLSTVSADLVSDTPTSAGPALQPPRGQAVALRCARP